MKAFAVVLLLAASPLSAQTFNAYAPPTGVNEGAPVTLQAYGAFGCSGAPADFGCDPVGYFFQPLDVLQWAFGDGGTATVTGSPAVSHVYAHAGLYTAKVHIVTRWGVADVSTPVYVASVPATTITASGYVDGVEGSSATVRLTRSGDLSRTNRVDWRLYGQDLTAKRIAPQSGTLIFAPGETEHSLTFAVTHDGYYFGDDYAFVGWTLSDGAIASGGVGPQDAWHIQSTIRTHDIDPVPAGVLRDVTVKKGSPSVRVPLDLIGSEFAAPCCRGDVGYMTADGTAHDAVDYKGTAGQSELIPPLSSVMFIEVPLVSNDLQGTRTFDVVLQPQWTDIPLLRSRATVTIVDDSLTLTADPARLTIGVGTYAAVKLTMGAPPKSPVSLSVVLSDPSVVASDGVGAMPASGTATLLIHALAPGHAVVTITPAGGAPASIEVDVVQVRRRAVR